MHVAHVGRAESTHPIEARHLIVLFFVMNLFVLSACVIVAVVVVVSGAVRQRHVSIGCLQYLLS